MTEDGVPFVAVVHGQGKVTVPKNVRDLLGIREGDLVEARLIRRVGPDVSAVPVPEAPPVPLAHRGEADAP